MSDFSEASGNWKASTTRERRPSRLGDQTHHAADTSFMSLEEISVADSYDGFENAGVVHKVMHSLRLLRGSEHF